MVSKGNSSLMHHKLSPYSFPLVTLGVFVLFWGGGGGGLWKWRVSCGKK